MEVDNWQFWIDRGGTFTDIVARNPNGEVKAHKLLSENVGRYVDAPVQEMKDIMGLDYDDKITMNEIDVIKML
ncbi:Hydantoinase/oxoprolinase N-terminal region [Selenihalanaerobacter shriftii]|uniref:Hydantoinase/oxoprolinase N-terminal region n=1 Tax=Selenihalanaerobacter shriftii TaxID=142842 RepID=A0A1T4R1S4_9FIRM|nr:Hydantoinase/oxoprolinase N-terminal region [Selenihalanaerobacter shriftii]